MVLTEIKKCRKCSEIKSVDNFYKESNNKKGYRNQCISCFRGSCNSKRQAYENKLIRDYNMTAVDYNNLHDIQGGRCKTCNITVSNSVRETEGEGVGVIDHCHTSGKVRGILCAGCNLSIGHAKDNAKTLVALAHYLLENGDGC